MEICKNCYWCHHDGETICSNEETDICKFDEDGDHDEVYVDDEMVPVFVELRERGYDAICLYDGGIRSTETTMAMYNYVETNNETGKYLPLPSQDLALCIYRAGDRDADEFFTEKHLLDLLPEEFMVDKDHSTNGKIAIRKKYVNYVCDEQSVSLAYKDLCKARIKLLEYVEKLPYANGKEN